MASSWSSSWANSWGNSWGAITVEETLAGFGNPWINRQQEEDDIMVIINAFLTMKH